MTKPALTTELAYKALDAFFTQNDKPFVLFATGTSCALDLDFGMPALEKHLKDTIGKEPLSEKQRDEWNIVIELLESKKDFESSMDSITDNELLKIVIDKTAELVLEVDQRHMHGILQGKVEWSAISIIQAIVSKLQGDESYLHVATPNYDMLAEYAFCQAEIPYITGFWGGVIKKVDWRQSARQVTYKGNSLKGKSREHFRNHIRLYKVHGSLNTYKYNDEIIETDAWNNCDVDAERIMITPGTSKHEKLHDYRTVLLSEYDKRLSEHNSFLFLGFGFNDTQLVKSTIEDKLTNKNAHALIITRDSNERIEELLENSKNAWLVCKNEDNESTRIYNCQYDNWLYLADKEIWKFDKFSSDILGT